MKTNLIVAVIVGAGVVFGCESVKETFTDRSPDRTAMVDVGADDDITVTVPNEALAKDGVGHLRTRDWDSAVSSFEKAVAANPKNPDLRFALGVAYEARGDLGKAEENYKSALHDRNDKQFEQALMRVQRKRG
jgi:Flp pilus assembly protein TadD